MENGFFLTAGTSRGIGEALAQKIMEEGNTFLCISRNRFGSLQGTNYYPLPLNLTETSRINQIIDKTNEILTIKLLGLSAL